ncbi:MAG: hypothetical protein BGO96_09580 [Micrococcales bacterium 73-15]|nr:MAG: hypothetical protein BGO96_09580 [Micrococcales bacterium 73-15]
MLTLDSAAAQSRLTATFERITPDLAREYLGKNTGNRNLKPLKIGGYVRDILADRFLPTGESIKFDWNGRLIDGQNRLTAVIESGKPVTILVVRGLDPEVQKILDTGSKRSAGDALKMSGHHTNPHILAAAIRLIAAWKDGNLTNSASRAPDLTHAEVLEWHNTLGTSVDSAVALASRWYKAIDATPSPLATAIYLTSEVDAEDSFKFFSGMAEMDLGGREDPRTILLTRLRTLHGEKSIPAQQIYFILRAWNAWRSDQVLRGMKDSSAGVAAKIPEPK